MDLNYLFDMLVQAWVAIILFLAPPLSVIILFFALCERGIEFIISKIGGWINDNE